MVKCTAESKREQECRRKERELQMRDVVIEGTGGGKRERDREEHVSGPEK